MLRFVTKGEKAKCGKMVIETNYKEIYLSKTSVIDAETIKPQDIKVVQYLKNTMDFLYQDIRNQITAIYQETIVNDFKLKQEIQLNRLSIFIANPELVAPEIFGKGLESKIDGEVLRTYKCNEVIVKLIEYTECVKELPEPQ